MKRRLVSVMLSVMMIMTMAFGGVCAAQAEEETHKLGFLAPTLQTEFFIGIDDGLQEECAARGWDYVAVSFENDSAEAVTSIENMVTGGCDVIVAMVSDSSCDSALAAAQEEGVYIIECGVETDVHDVVLNTDQYLTGVQIGEMASDWINDQLDGEGKVVVFTTYQDQDMQDRGQGIQDALEENAPDAEILEVVDIGKDVVGSGTDTAENMLQKYPEMNVIACYGDAAAVEAMEAVKAAGVDLESFGIFSCDGTNQALAGIANGDAQKGTVQFDAMGPIFAEYAQKLFDGETFDEPVIMSGNIITADNIDEYYGADAEADEEAEPETEAVTE